MDNDDESMHTVKGLIIVWACLVAILLVLTLLDMQIKRAMIETATQFRREVDNARGKPAGPPPAPRVPHPVPGVHGLGDVGADGAAAQEDGVAAEAAPIVRAGDESARPPHRGSVDGA